jgi:PIN domain nuclease of toxin-antitoxin system
MTSFLLDTHAMLWFFWDDSKLSSHARTLIEDRNNRKLVSIATATDQRRRSV